MEVTILQAVGIGLVALFAYMVDTFAYAQWDRPIFTCLLVGLVLGDLEQALILGANLELLYMGTMSIGAALPPDIYTGGILGVAFAIVTGTGVEGAITLCLPIASLALAVKAPTVMPQAAITSSDCRPMDPVEPKIEMRLLIRTLLSLLFL